MRRLIAAALLLCLAACATGTPPQYVVYFPKGDATLTPDAQAVVTEIAGAAKSNPGKLVVACQADGGKAADATLADDRATVVIKALATAGIASKLTSTNVIQHARTTLRYKREGGR